MSELVVIGLPILVFVLLAPDVFAWCVMALVGWIIKMLDRDAK